MYCIVCTDPYVHMSRYIQCIEVSSLEACVEAQHY